MAMQLWQIKMRDLVIIGAGGFGREVYSWVCVLREDYGMFSVSPPPRIYASITLDNSGPVLKHSHIEGFAVVTIGNPDVRKRIVKEANDVWNREWASLVHPSVLLSGCEMGRGTVLCPGVIISVDCRIGNHVHINFASTIGHDCIIGDFVTISPGVHISGNVTIGDEVFIGTGAVIREKLTIGEGATIGMGAVVVKDVPPGVTVVGNPAREMNMSRRLYWPIRSKKAQAEPVAYENNQNNESGFINPLLLGGVEDGYISYDGEKRKIHPDDVEKFMAYVTEHRA